jgi:hypothetical protein
LFDALQTILRKAEGNGGESNVEQSHTFLSEKRTEDRRRKRGLEDLKGILAILDQLWQCKSKHMAQAAELLANKSRDRKTVVLYHGVSNQMLMRLFQASWRMPYGQAGILEFFLRIVASQDVADDVLLHSLRLIGNSCADAGWHPRLISMLILLLTRH